MDQETYEKRKKQHIEAGKAAFERMKNRQLSKNKWKSYIDSIRYKLIPYEPRWNTHNTSTHELAKAKVSLMLKKAGRFCYCEVIFKSCIGGRCDILLPYENTIMEIMHTEKEVKGYYPDDFTIIPLKAEDVLKEGFCL